MEPIWSFVTILEPSFNVVRASAGRGLFATARGGGRRTRDRGNRVVTEHRCDGLVACEEVLTFNRQNGTHSGLVSGVPVALETHLWPQSQRWAHIKPAGGA